MARQKSTFLDGAAPLLLLLGIVALVAVVSLVVSTRGGFSVSQPIVLDDRVDAAEGNVAGQAFDRPFILEKITCVFSDKGQHSCVSSLGSCTGAGSCIVEVTGAPQTTLSWTSPSCPGGQKTILDGKDETVVFSSCTPEASCSDSDGGVNYYVLGSLTLNGSINGGSDVCINETMIKELSCKNSGPFWRDAPCPFRCINGACVNRTNPPTCYDSDGGSNIYWYGKTYLDNNIFVGEDTCVNQTVIREWYCTGYDAQSSVFSCGEQNKYCTNGQCRNSTGG